ncbi:MAG: hypothetical protein CMF04_04830 [Hyphomonas sp.]|nr:hypothetical protein [Hyphomonas sp.]
MWPNSSMAEDIPITRNRVASERAESIRQRIRKVDCMGEGPNASRLAMPEDAAGLLALLSDPAVHAPIYSLPRPLTLEAVQGFIDGHLEERERGEGLLLVREQNGQIMGYSDFQIWPDWAAGELGGALHPSQHSKGQGTRGAAQSFGWMFDALDLDLLCMTASLENTPTQRLLDGLGFARMGCVISTRPDGTTRESLVWEMTREAWQRRSPADTH